MANVAWVGQMGPTEVIFELEHSPKLVEAYPYSREGDGSQAEAPMPTTGIWSLEAFRAAKDAPRHLDQQNQKWLFGAGQRISSTISG